MIEFISHHHSALNCLVFMLELSHLNNILDPSRCEIWSIFILVDTLIKIEDKNQHILRETIQETQMALIWVNFNNMHYNIETSSCFRLQV